MRPAGSLYHGVERIRLFGWISVMLVLLFLQGCGGGGGSSAGPTSLTSSAPDESGEVVIAITDAEGDFAAYEVDVEYLRLRGAFGDVVETVPLTTRIDFAELVELTEFFTIASVPAGTYTSVTLGLDFSDAEILVQDDAGRVSAAVPVDAAGERLARLEIAVRLPEDEPIRVVPGVPAHVTVDFDLDASNTIDLTASPPQVAVEPFLFVTGELETDREHRVRGLLASVNEARSAFTLDVRPFRHRRGDFGRFTALTDDATRYQLNGDSFTGAEGLAALAALDSGTPTVVLGGAAAAGFVAQVVVAGSDVPWSDIDLLRGVVLARDSTSLTVRGVLVSFRDTVAAQRGTFRVEFDDALMVTTRHLDPPLSAADLSVGQRVSIAGELTDDVTLKARRAVAHLNQLTATVVDPGPLVVDLAFVNGLRPAAFDFTGTGSAPELDSNPEHYEIDTGTLGLPAVVPGDLLRVRGLVNSFGMAPPDFLARTVIDVNTERRAATLWVGWPEGTGRPFSSVAPDRLDVDVSAARHALKLRGLDPAAGDLEQIALLPPGDRPGAYLVAVRGAGELHAYRDFANLVAELERQLADGMLLRRVRAHGRYNAHTVELTAARAAFEFIAP